MPAEEEEGHAQEVDREVDPGLDHMAEGRQLSLPPWLKSKNLLCKPSWMLAEEEADPDPRTDLDHEFSPHQEQRNQRLWQLSKSNKLQFRTLWMQAEEEAGLDLGPGEGPLQERVPLLPEQKKEPSLP